MPDAISDSATDDRRDAASRPPRDWRGGIMTGLLLATGLLLIGRLIHVQAAQRELMHDRVARQSRFTEVIAARPGEILDRNGLVLAMTIPAESVYAVPSEIEDVHAFAWQMADVLGLNADELFSSLQQSRRRQFLWLRRRISAEQAAAIRTLPLPPESWGIRREYLRQYPQGRYAAHVLGIRDIDNVGRGGLEESQNDVIRGRDGVRALTRDARGVTVEVTAEDSVPPQHGRTVVCSLDLLTQVETERQLDLLVEQWNPKGACAIVLEPRSGQIMAMASRPSFDPNSLQTATDASWKNLSVSAVFEPGSTFKPLVVGWALGNGDLQRDDMIDCNLGSWRMGKRILHDHHPYGELSVEDILVKSSNIGMARIAERRGLDSLYRCTVSFGFGRPTGIELPGELPGLLRPRNNWDDYSLGSIPMGQELAVTPLQLIAAHAALANGGRLVRPHLLMNERETAATGALTQLTRPAAAPDMVESRLLSPSVCRWLVMHPMTQVVERGTGTGARIDGVDVFGKTGTAQKLDPETGRYSDKAWVVSFLCGAPSRNPAVLVLVMVDEPTAPGSHYGGTVAAPTAAKILAAALQRVDLPPFERTVTER